jgi:amidase
MITAKEYASYDALGLAELVRKSEVTPLELLETAIKQVEAQNPALNAVVNRMYDLARKSIADGLPDGPLKGVPFLLKDLGVFYPGVATSFGSNFLADFVPDFESSLVRRYRQAGLVIFGKTNTPEFGLTVTTEPRLFGPCRNPWNLEKTTGGSSGGAAAAVATGMVPAAHASDGGGSIRIPASCCGLFGLKPTRGRVSCGPDRGEDWNGMSVNHAITRSVRDSAAFLDIAAGFEPGDPYFAPPPVRPYLEEIKKTPLNLKIAFTTIAPTGAAVDPACVAATHMAAGLCREWGHKVVEAAPKVDFESLQAAMVAIININLASALEIRAKAKGRELKPEDVEKITWRAAATGRKISATAYAQAVLSMHRASRQIAKFFESYDTLLSPVLLSPPVDLGYLDMMSEDAGQYLKNLSSFFGFTSMFNATGQPAMSVPLYWTDDNLPVGLQFAARYGDEATLFRLAAQLEASCPWKDRRPDLP